MKRNALHSTEFTMNILWSKILIRLELAINSSLLSYNIWNIKTKTIFSSLATKKKEWSPILSALCMSFQKKSWSLLKKPVSFRNSTIDLSSSLITILGNSFKMNNSALSLEVSQTTSNKTTIFQLFRSIFTSWLRNGLNILKSWQTKSFSVKNTP